MMSIRPLFRIITTFSLAAGMAFWWSVSHPPEATAGRPTQAVPARRVPNGNATGPLSLPASFAPGKPSVLNSSTTRESDDRLAKRSQELLATDPAAAFRAAMSEWRFDRDALNAAAEALVKKDPDTARRLLAECPDLRSRNVLECFLAADEVSRDPQGKLAWADSSLTGNVRVAALTAGLEALVKLDPEAALAFASNLPPSLGTYNATNKMLRELMLSDSGKAIAWMSSNLSPDKMGITSSILFMALLKEKPGEGAALLPTLPAGLQKTMAFAMVARAGLTADTRLPYFPQLLEAVHSLPAELQSDGLAALEWSVNPQSSGKTHADLLSLLSDPGERSELVRRLVGKQLRYAGSDPNAPLPAGLDIIQTPADKQEVARMLPWLKDLSEGQRSALEARLK